MLANEPWGKNLTKVVHEYIDSRLREVNQKGCENCGGELKAKPIHHTSSNEYKVVLMCEKCKHRTLLD